ncbi:MAG: flagellin [Gemmatimonadaceae bacterium]
MYIQTNVTAMNALRNIGVTEQNQSRSIEKLSSGFRLNRAGDDAAGLSIANSLRSNARGLMQAGRNASQATSVLQIADGATQTISNILDRMKELATESASDNVTDTDRSKIDAEFTSLKSEISRTIGSTTYQGTTLLDGNFGASVDSNVANSTLISVGGVSGVSSNGAAAGKTFTITQTATTVALDNGVTGAGNINQTLAYAGGAATLNFDKLGVSFTAGASVSTSALNGKAVKMTAATGGNFRVGAGATSDADNIVNVALGDLSLTGLGLSGSGVANNAAATTALTTISSALASLNTTIGTIGAAQNRLDYATASVNSLYQNVSAAESVIRDTNMAQEYTNFSKQQILQQAGTAMLAQANTSAQSVLQLIK